jgi:hypothetical protein
MGARQGGNVDNRKRIRELTDETIALADDKTLCQAEKALRIKTKGTRHPRLAASRKADASCT